MIEIRVKVTDQDVLYANTLPTNSYAHQFRVGDKEVDAIGKAIAEVISVERYNISADRQVVYLDMRVRATYDTRSKRFSVHGRNLAFGTPMRFNLDGVVFDGIITDFPGLLSEPNRQKRVIVKALGRKVEPSVAASVQKGDRVVDSKSKVLIEVIDSMVKKEERVVATDRGDLLLRYDPIFKDLELTLQINARQVDGVLYVFDDQPLKIGEQIPLNYSSVSVLPMITEIISVEDYTQ